VSEFGMTGSKSAESLLTQFDAESGQTYFLCSIKTNGRSTSGKKLTPRVWRPWCTSRDAPSVRHPTSALHDAAFRDPVACLLAQLCSVATARLLASCNAD
jgi:hypothetical protein